MKVTVEERPQREAQLNIEVEPEDLEKYLDRAYRKVVQQITIPGFRKGKAPRRIVEGMVGKDALLDEAISILVPDATSKAIQEKGLNVVAQPVIEVVQKDPVTLKVMVATRPEVALNNHREVRVEKEEVKVTDEQIEGILKRLHHDLSPWEPVTRPIQFDDLVTLSIKGQAGERLLVNNQNVTYVLTKDSTWPVLGVVEQLQGMTAGQTKEFAITIPQDYVDKELAGKECQFTVTANEAKEKKLVPLDDEFAKGVGEGFETLEALRQKVKSDFIAQTEQAIRNDYEEKVLAAVMERATVEMSPLLVEHEVEHIMMDEDEALKKRRLSLEEYLKRVGKKPEELREELKPEAMDRLKRSLVLQKVAELEDVKVTAEDLEKEVENIAKESPGQEDAVRRLLKTPERTEALFRMILTRKTLQRLVEIASGQAPEPVAAPAAPEAVTAPQSEEATSDKEAK